MVERRRNPLGKALQMIRHLVETPDRAWGVREIARELGMSHSTAHRTLNLLEDEGFVEQDRDTAAYRLGLEFFRLAWQATNSHSMRNAALPILRDLVEECNETGLFGLYDPNRGEMMFVATVESSHPLRYVIELNRWLPIHAGATGLAILAFLPSDEQQDIINHAFTDPPLTASTIADPSIMATTLEEVRKKGYARTHGQRIQGAVGIAAPVWAPAKRVIGDVAVTLPEQRFSLDQEKRLAESVITAAARLTRQLGGITPEESLTRQT